MERDPDWFELLFEHTKRQGNLAQLQILVIFGFSGFVWSKKTPPEALAAMLFIYIFFAIYLTVSIYRVQDRRITLWRFIALNQKLGPQVLKKFKEEKLFHGIIKLFEYQDSCYEEDDPEKIRFKYIEKLRPSKKRLVLTLHILANILALLIIIFSAIYKNLQ